MPASRENPRERLVRAAFDLFEEQGYDHTTVDDIAQRAGVGRTTFFRTAGSKEEVIFPDHEQILARIEERLEASSPGSRSLAITDAARIVLRHYLDEGSVARDRYRLTRKVPALKAREIAGLRKYERLFSRVLGDWWAQEPRGALRAELVAAGIVTAHNHVLRSWLQERTSTPEQDLDAALGLVLASASSTGRPTESPTTVIVVSGTTADGEATAARIRSALDG